MILENAQHNIRVVQDLRHPRLMLLAPIYVTVEEQDDVVVVSNADMDIFGYGDTEAEALQDFREIVAETYYDLQAEQDNLSSHSASIWVYVNRMTVERVVAERHAAQKATCYDVL